MKFRSVGDSTSSRVQDKLKTIRLSCTVEENYTRVHFRMNERSSNSAGSSVINSFRNAS